MNIKTQLMKEHSKKNRDLILNYLLQSPDKLDDLMRLFFEGETMIVQRAAWVVGGVGEARPEMIEPYFSKMIKLLKKDDRPDAVKRNILRVIQFHEMDESIWGELYDTCIQILTDKKEPIAVKAFAMTTAFNIVKKLPELKNELRVVIEDLVEEGSAGVKNRGQKILSALSKL